jgi:hypothetical protein
MSQTYPSGGGAWVPSQDQTPTGTWDWSKAASVTGIPGSAIVGQGGLLSAHATYSFAVDGGAISTITPVGTAALPNKAIITGVTINFSTAVTSAGSATVAVGTSAGSSTTSLLAATAKASCTGLVAGVPTLAAPIELTAAGNITVTIATAALTAGVAEIFVYYVVSPS